MNRIRRVIGLYYIMNDSFISKREISRQMKRKVRDSAVKQRINIGWGKIASTG